uniref:SPRY domain-containing protein n=1 Tax=Globodera pallida TaxID=36090 RepID=A0A183CB41_GLOPA
MATFLFLAAIFLLVAASILLETDASPKPNKNTKLEKRPSSADNAESTPGQPPENPWAALHKDLKLNGPDGLIVQNNGEEKKWCSVRAKLPIPKDGIFYYEVTILEKGFHVHIGLATEQIPLDEPFGWSKGTYAYASWGSIWGHEASNFLKGKPQRPYIKGKPIFSRRRQLLKTSGLKVDSAAELYPCVSLYDPGTKIEANFGTKEFKFDIAKAFEN